MSDYVEQTQIHSAFDTQNSWVILSPIEESIKRKIEAVGVPLKDWDININYGIKTGFNDAFIISRAKKEEILANCKTDDERRRTDELIRPILRGRDIKRYGYEFADKWLIATLPSRHYDINQYPSVKNYLLSFGMERLEQSGIEHIVNGKKIKARKKTNNQWFETQDSISYWEDFSKPKIVWGEISDKTKFCMDINGSFCCEATTFLMTGENLPYIYAFLNSTTSEYLFSKIGTTTGVGTIRWKKYKIEQLFIACIEKIGVAAIEKLEGLVRALNDNSDFSIIIRKIDDEIYKIYQFDSNEIQYIESNL